MPSKVQPSSSEAIELRGVSTHNLKGVDVAFPLGQISVVTGVSGSGKSSLVFDSLYGEAYRRYVESLSSFARQYLKALPKPEIEQVVNLQPAIAVKQSRSGATSRSTVGTLTEMYDLIRVLFVHLGELYCPVSGELVARDTPESVAEDVVANLASKKVLVAAPLADWENLQPEELKTYLAAQGFTRILTGGEVNRLDDVPAEQYHAGAIVVDRTSVAADRHRRIADSVQLAMKLGRGVVEIYDTEDMQNVWEYSDRLESPHTDMTFLEPSAALLSFNHPLGACSHCQGFGFASVLDWNRVLPDMSASLSSKGVAPWNFGKHVVYYRWAKEAAIERGLDPETPFAQYSAKDMQWLKEGDGDYDGVLGYFAYLERKKYKTHYRIHAARFRKYVLCSVCDGARLNEQALAVRLGDANMAEICQRPLKEVASWLADVERSGAKPSTKRDTGGLMGLKEAFEEATARLQYLEKIGLGYLNLNRPARTLSGGEMQRINMARSLGSALTDTLFCLDEPSAGLHARDSSNLLDVIKELRDQGNTVVVVEHERTVIDGADHLIEVGPAAGHRGGDIVFAGPAKKQKQTPVDQAQDPGNGSDKTAIAIKGASTHNLKGIDVRFPTRGVTVVCGVSGSGKTSLVQHTLYPLLAEALGQDGERHPAATPNAKSIGPKKTIEGFAEVLLVSQGALGRSSRSNIATYLGIMNDIRKLMAEQPQAKVLKLKPGHFSFNVAGGRCETCRGLGTIVEDLSFLGEMEVICPDCEGRRFIDDVLSVRYRGRTLIDILALTVEQAREFFHDLPGIAKVCDVVLDLGLGYVTLGQHTSSFSGGEAQRLKLVSLMRTVRTKKKKSVQPSILIFDEPTTGLSDRDVANLINQLRILSEAGHMIVVIEHHLDLIRAADWLIEIGPEAADLGGEVVYAGRPLGLKKNSKSVTAPFIN